MWLHPLGTEKELWHISSLSTFGELTLTFQKFPVGYHFPETTCEHLLFPILGYTLCLLANPLHIDGGLESLSWGLFLQELNLSAGRINQSINQSLILSFSISPPLPLSFSISLFSPLSPSPTQLNPSIHPVLLAFPSQYLLWTTPPSSNHYHSLRLNLPLSAWWQYLVL